MRNIGVVAVVFMGILVVAQAIALVNFTISMWPMFWDEGFPGVLMVLASIVPVAVTLAFGAYLITRRHQLADAWFNDDSAEVVIEPEILLRTGLILVGVWLIATSLPSFARPFLTWIVQAVRDGTMDSVFAESAPPMFTGFLFALPDLLVLSVEMAFGALLILRSRQIAERLWNGASEAAEKVCVDHLCPSCGEPYDPSGYRDDVTEPRCSKCGASVSLDSP